MFIYHKIDSEQEGKKGQDGKKRDNIVATNCGLPRQKTRDTSPRISRPSTRNYTNPITFRLNASADCASELSNDTDTLGRRHH